MDRLKRTNEPDLQFGGPDTASIQMWNPTSLRLQIESKQLGNKLSLGVVGPPAGGPPRKMREDLTSPQG
jgi:hypothetical protein